MKAAESEKNNLADIIKNEDIHLNFREFLIMMQQYRAGIKEVQTKLEILDEEFHVKYKYNPIHQIISRMKEPQSIINKIKKYNIPITIDSIRKHVRDIAGIRVICNYTDDVERIMNLLINQNDIKLIAKKDYIKNPKESGYRSLHIVVEVPVFLAEETMNTPVEVQIRTIAMDFWASLDHQLRYKNPDKVTDELRTRLKNCSEDINKIDLEMQAIQKKIYQLDDE